MSKCDIYSATQRQFVERVVCFLQESSSCYDWQQHFPSLLRRSWYQQALWYIWGCVSVCLCVRMLTYISLCVWVILWDLAVAAFICQVFLDEFRAWRNMDLSKFHSCLCLYIEHQWCLSVFVCSCLRWSVAVLKIVFIRKQKSSLSSWIVFSS